MRFCNTCKTERPEGDFYKYANGKRKGAFVYPCKSCVASRNKNRHDRNSIRIRNRDLLKDGLKICNCKECRLLDVPQPVENFYLFSSGEYGSVCKECLRRINGSEKTLATKRKYANSEKGKRKTKIWREGNVKKVNSYSLHYNKRRKAKLLGLLATFTEGDWKFALAYWGGLCAYCRKRDGIAKDHFIPISKGGPYTPENIVPACTNCNSQKHKKLPSEFLNEQQMNEISRFFASVAQRIKEIE